MADENPGNGGKDAGNDGGDKPAGEHINLRVVAQVRFSTFPAVRFFCLTMRAIGWQRGSVQD
jgi:hypothetical protein